MGDYKLNASLCCSGYLRTDEIYFESCLCIAFLNRVDPRIQLFYRFFMVLDNPRDISLSKIIGVSVNRERDNLLEVSQGRIMVSNRATQF